MSLTPMYNRLQQSWQQLRQQWQTASGLWHDDMQLQFEHEFWQPLESQLPQTLTEFERLAQVIAQARQNVR